MNKQTKITLSIIIKIKMSSKNIFKILKFYYRIKFITIFLKKYIKNFLNLHHRRSWKMEHELEVELELESELELECAPANPQNL